MVQFDDLWEYKILQKKWVQHVKSGEWPQKRFGLPNFGNCQLRNRFFFFFEHKQMQSCNGFNCESFFGHVCWLWWDHRIIYSKRVNK